MNPISSMMNGYLFREKSSHCLHDVLLNEKMCFNFFRINSAELGIGMRRDTYGIEWCWAGWQSSSDSENSCEQHNETEYLKDEIKINQGHFTIVFNFGCSPA
jgi:hypothetical protein